MTSYDLIAIVLSTLLVTCSAFSIAGGNLREGRVCSAKRIVPNANYPLVSTRLRAFSEDGREAEAEESSSSDTHLVFPGGGIFFYWQAGAVTYLREQGYDLSKTTLSGASAGALTATLTATGVDFVKATTLALELAEEAGVWDRSAGLQGIWGPIIEEWLDELLPADAVNMVDGRLSLLVTPVPSFGKSKISDFRDRKDLIHCNMASVHLPWFLNSKLTSNFRGAPHIDGSFLAKATDYHPAEPNSMISFDWTEDPIMAKKAIEFVKVISKEGIWNIKETGMRFAEKLEADGRFEMLKRFQDETYAEKRERIGVMQRALRK